MNTPLPTPQEPLSEAAIVPMPAEQREELRAGAMDVEKHFGHPASYSVGTDVILGTIRYVEHLEAALSAATSRAAELEAKAKHMEHGMSELRLHNDRMIAQRDKAQSALAALQEREAAARPIPVDESLPVILEDRGHSFAVQVWIDGRSFIYPAFFSKSGWHEQGGSCKLKKVTHWRHFGPDHALSVPVEPTEQPAEPTSREENQQEEARALDEEEGGPYGG